MSFEAPLAKGERRAQSVPNPEPKLLGELSTRDLAQQIIYDPFLGGNTLHTNPQGVIYRSTSWEMPDGSSSFLFRVYGSGARLAITYDLLVARPYNDSSDIIFDFSNPECVQKTIHNNNLAMHEVTTIANSDPQIMELLREGYRKTENYGIAEIRQSVIDDEAIPWLDTLNFGQEPTD